MWFGVAIEMASISLRSSSLRKSVTWSSLRPLSFSNFSAALPSTCSSHIAQRDQVILVGVDMAAALAVEADHRHADLAVDIGSRANFGSTAQAAAAPAACCRNTRRVCLDMKTPLRMRSRELPTVARRPAHSTVMPILTAGRQSATLVRVRFWRGFLEISGRDCDELLALSC